MGRRKSSVISINPLFKLLILINLSLCGICLVVMVSIGMFAPKDPTELQRQLYGACETVFKMTAGAFISPDPSQLPPIAPAEKQVTGAPGN